MNKFGMYVITQKQWKDICLNEKYFNNDNEFQNYMSNVVKWWNNKDKLFVYKCFYCHEQIGTYLWDLVCPLCKGLYIDDNVHIQDMLFAFKK